MSHVNSFFGFQMPILAFTFELRFNFVSLIIIFPQVLPKLSDLTHPHFWTETEQEALLGPAGLLAPLRSDIEHMKTEYETIALPFIRQHKGVFDEDSTCVDALALFSVVSVTHELIVLMDSFLSWHICLIVLSHTPVLCRAHS